MAKMFLQLAIVALATLQFGAAHETAEVPVVVVSQHQLRKDIRKEVTAVVQQATANITDSIHQVTRKVDWAVTDVIEPLRDEITAQVNAALEDAIADVTDAVEILLKPLMDQLSPPPGKTSTRPAASCEEVKYHNPTAPSGYYWVQNSAIPLVQVYCKMDEVEILLGKDSSHPASSCKEIKDLNPGLPSGYCWIKAANESSIRVYCDMDRTCGGITGGWMRVANVNMKNTSHTCPQGLREVTKLSKRLCTKTIVVGCSSATFDVYGTEYTHVCGKVIGYQDKTPDGFGPYNGNTNLGIDDVYVDGVILTHGMNPRKHIWTFAASRSHADFRGQCPCINTSLNTRIPPWVGSDYYFCDTANRAGAYQHIFYPDDPLWDGEGCPPTNSCCSFNSPPWFSKQLSSPTADNMELRACTNANDRNEDVPIESMELYIQ